MGKRLINFNKRVGIMCACLFAAFLIAASAFLYAPLAAQALPVEDMAYLITAGKGVSSVKAAEITPGGLGTSNNPKTGLTVRGGEGYEASVNGVFKGDTRIEFAFVYYPIVGNGTGGGDFSFIVADAGNPEDYFEVRYVNRSNFSFNTVAHVYYKGQIRGASYNGTSYSGTSVTTSAAWGAGSILSPVSRVQAYFWGNIIASEPYISFEWNGDILEVATTGRGSSTRCVLARFDGTEGQSGTINSSRYKLPKLNNFLENGYTVSFKSPYNGIDVASAIALASSDLISAAAGQGDAAAAAAALEAAVNDKDVSASASSQQVDDMKTAATKAKNAAAAVPVNNANLAVAAKDALEAAVAAYASGSISVTPLRDAYNASQGGIANAAEVAAAAERTKREPGNDIIFLKIKTEYDSPNGFDNDGGIELKGVRLFSEPWWYSEYLNRLPWFTVAFNSDGGTEVGAVSVRKGSKVTEPASPEREGYVFGGWYKDGGFSAPWVFSSDVIEGNTTLYAKWTEKEAETEPEKPRGCKKKAAEAVSALLVLAAAVFIKKKI